MEIIRRIKIRSEADLPKEKRDCFVHIKNSDTLVQSDHLFLDKEYLNGKIDWYLLIEDLTDTDIEAWARKTTSSTMGTAFDFIVEQKIFAVKAILNGEIKHIEK